MTNRPEESDPGPTMINLAAGMLDGTLVQARDIGGSVHIHANTADRIPPRQLPTDLDDFVGRRDVQLALHALLERSVPTARTAVISAIDGTGGIGKTALAVHWAHSARHLFTDGDLYINLHGYDFKAPVQPEDSLDSFLRALGVPPADIPPALDAKASLYRSVLYDKKLLIVLDNAATVDQVEPLLPGGGSSFVLITSRSRLPGLSTKYTTARFSLDLLGHDEAIAMLRNALGDEVIDREEPEAAALVDLAAGLPLAIRIISEIARAKPNRSLRALVGELSTSERDIESFQTADESVKLSTVFTYSYQLLSQEDARVFRLLSIHPGALISVEAAAALTGQTTLLLQRTLRRLANAHLIEEGADERFHFHDLLRLFAQDCAQREEVGSSRDIAFSGLATWYLNSAVAASAVLMPQRAEIHLPSSAKGHTVDFSDYSAAVSWCELERENIRLVIIEAADRGLHDLAWMTAVAMRGFYNLRKHWPDWQTTHEVALTAAQSVGNKYAEGRVLNGLGTVFRQTGRLAEAAHFHQAAVDLRLSMGDSKGAASALDSLGHVYREQRDRTSASDCFQASFRLRQEANDVYGQAWSLNNLGELALDSGDLAEAANLLLDSYHLRVQVGDAWGGGRTLHNLGMCARAQKNLEEGRGFFRKAIRQRSQIHDAWGTAQSLDALGDLEEQAHNPHEALQHWTTAHQILVQLDDPYAEVLLVKIGSRSRSAGGSQDL